MAENEKRLKELTSSLMQLNVRIAPSDGRKFDKNSKGSTSDDQKLSQADLRDQEEGDVDSNKSESSDKSQQPNSNVIANTAPIKSKITIAHSKILTNLSDRATDSLFAVSKRSNIKVQIRFKSIGSINQLRPAVFKISRSSRFLSILRFLTKRLRIKHVYCYLENSIVPSPDDSIGNLYDLFKSGDGELIVSYCNLSLIHI